MIVPSFLCISSDVLQDEGISFALFDLESQKTEVLACSISFVMCYCHMPAGSVSY